MSDFMAKPCAHCPFRRDVTPFLHPERAEEIAYSAENPYSSFTCHKTLDHDDEGETIFSQESKECAGALYMKHCANGQTWYDDDGFKPDPDWNCYEDSWEMTEAYQDEWDSQRKRA